MMKLGFTIAAAIGILASVPAAAQPASSKKAADPNAVVCEKQEVLGSRLATRRVCMTRAEWAERRRLERMEIDKAQVQVPVRQ